VAAIEGGGEHVEELLAAGGGAVRFIVL